MSHQPTATSSQGDAPTYAETEGLELFRRSPHPYHRHQDQLWNATPDPSLPSTPQSASPLRSSDHTRFVDSRRRRKPLSQSPSESGTEADDEGFNLIRALPAPPLRLHKGLRNPNGPGAEEWGSPLVTPTKLDHEGRKLSEDFLENGKSGPRRGHPTLADDEARAVRVKYWKRRRMELLRRMTETAELVAIGFLAVRGCGCWNGLLDWHRGKSACE